MPTRTFAPPRAARGFTLIEILVVVVIITILMGAVAVTVMGALRQGRIADCSNNLKQIGELITIYETEYDAPFPPYLSTLDWADYKMFICPLDGTAGSQGGRPDWITGQDQWSETNDMPYASFTAPDKSWYDSQVGGGGRAANLEAMRQKPGTGDSLNACSYLYEFSAERCTWYDGSYGFPDDASATWQKVKTYEANNDPEKKAYVPVVRCFWHIPQADDGQLQDDDQVNNVCIGGDVRVTTPDNWWK